MSLYNILYLMGIGVSLFAMDKKDSSSSNPKPAYSHHMQPTQVEFNNDPKTGTKTTTYTYSDGSKSTYITYKDSSDQKD